MHYIKIICWLVTCFIVESFESQAMEEFTSENHKNPYLIKEDSQLREICSQKTTLVLGGILPGASCCCSSSDIAVANVFSHICSPEDLAINIHPASNCHILGDAWLFEKTLEEFPFLNHHKFTSIIFNHIGDGFWGDQFTQFERSCLLSRGTQAVEEAICEKVKSKLQPIVSCLADSGSFIYKAFVHDFIDTFLEETQLTFLTPDLISTKPKRVTEEIYQGLDGRYHRIEAAYSLSSSDHPTIGGYERALRNMGLDHIVVEFVLSDRHLLDDCPDEGEEHETPDIKLQYLSHAAWKADYYSNSREASSTRKITNQINDIFLRISGKYCITERH